MLLRAGGIYRRPVLGADVVALTHALGWIVALPEHLEQIGVGNLRRIENDEDGFGMSGHTRTHLFIGRVRRYPASIAGRGRDDARDLPERALGAPEATHGEHGRLQPVAKRGRQRRVLDIMQIRHRKGLSPTGQRLGRCGQRQLVFLRGKPHGSRLSDKPVPASIPSPAAYLCACSAVPMAVKGAAQPPCRTGVHAGSARLCACWKKTRTA